MKEHSDKDEKKPQEQPPILRELLSAINAARRQISLYGSEHKSSEESIENLKKAIASIVRQLASCTIVFTKERLVVNDHCYVSSGDSKELYERMRARGAMAIGFIDSPSLKEVARLVDLLNAEPSDVREIGGPSAYLSDNDVQNIVATDAVYVSRGSTDHREPLAEAEFDPLLLDSAVCALIERSCGPGVEGGNEDVPLDDILASPDATAKLIWESVIKLHSTGSQQVGELGFQVIQNLRDMSFKKKAVWDLTTLQIRKAIAKLPTEVRATAFGFMSELPKPETDASQPKAAGPTETMVVNDTNILNEKTDLDRLFNLETKGLLSAWQKELQPETILRYSSQTIATLVAWETDATEHGRLARALALLVPKSLSMNNIEDALYSVESLLNEANLADAPPWRSANAKSALQSLGLQTLETVVTKTLAKDPSSNVAGPLIQAIPILAVNLAHFLRTEEHKAINEYIKQGMAKSGSEAKVVLRGLLRDEAPSARQAALETLVHIGTEWAMYEIGEAMRVFDEASLTSALALLPSMGAHSAVQTCAHYAEHPSPGVRIAALRALGDLGDPVALGSLIRAATWGKSSADERIAAIHSLRQIKHPDAFRCLQSLAGRRPLFGRSRYEPIRIAAEQAIGQGGVTQDG